MDVGVIGTGFMGKNHIRNYSEMKSVDSVFIYDVDEQSTNDIEEHYSNIDGNVYACKSMESFVDVSDAISICVPTQYHKNTIENILKIKNVDMLIENPMCHTTSEALKLLKILPKYNIIGVGHTERFSPIIPEIAKIIKDPLYIEFKRYEPSSPLYKIDGSNVVKDLMIHDIDIMRELFCKCPTSVYSVGNYDIYNVIIMCGLLPIHLSASRESSKKIRSIYIEMGESTLEADCLRQEITIYNKPNEFNLDKNKYSQENLVKKILVKKVEPLREELETFINCSIKHIPFPVSVDDAINNLMICDSIYNKGIYPM